MRLLPHSLTAIRVFDAVARHMSCSEAAKELFITQSAISKQLHVLEESLGVRLFVRAHKGMTLTEAGQAYWTCIRPALRLLERAAERARDAQSRQDAVAAHAVPPG